MATECPDSATVATTVSRLRTHSLSAVLQPAHAFDDRYGADMADTPIPVPEGTSEFMRAAGLHFVDIGPKVVTGWIDLGPEHHQPWGLVHGGVYTSAIESAASVGASTAAAEHGLVAVGVNNNTNFLRSMVSGRVAVHATAIQQGRTAQLWEVRVSDGDERLVAIGQVRLQNVTPRT
jgi:1,4-dihydroxy-2-naphthoyl-CoA hydrolase